MNEAFFKFPSTPHLALLGDVDVRADKVMSRLEREAFLGRELVVEEKIDGANLGISFDSGGRILAQNRGAYLAFPGAGQWKNLEEWLAPRMDRLFDALADRYLLFGEWCYARHTVHYDRLPDWFLGFDVFDKHVGRFLSVERRNEFLAELQVAAVPAIASGRFDLSELKGLLGRSKYGDDAAEGLYLRFDVGDWLGARAKLVRPSFVQTMGEHWTHAGIQPNRLG